MTERYRVAAIMPLHGRRRMARKALECFRRRSYRNAYLLVYLTDNDPFDTSSDDVVMVRGGPHANIGDTRNAANAHADADILINWDSDDWHARRRIEIQTELLTAGMDASGVSVVPFWDEDRREAWLYTAPLPGYAPTGTLCYWRRTWERHPFFSSPHGEAAGWTGAVRMAVTNRALYCGLIHSGNTSRAYRHPLLRASETQGGEWRQAPALNDWCREKFS